MMRTRKFLMATVIAIAGALPVTVHAAGSDSDTVTNPAVGQAQELLDKKQYDAAIPLLTGSLATSPEDADAWNLLGYATRKVGRAEEAEGHYLKALAINAEHKGALEYLGMLYVSTKRMADAEAVLKRLDSACFFGCDEYDDLKNAIATGEAEKD